jgi:hypothetical protein
VIAPNGVPCCDVSDGHRTSYDVRGGAYWVPIEGQWMQVPERAVIRDQGNPIGEAVVWYVHHRGSIIISCFVPPMRLNRRNGLPFGRWYWTRELGGADLDRFSASDLPRSILPSLCVIAKARPEIDVTEKFIGMSPFCVPLRQARRVDPRRAA